MGLGASSPDSLMSLPQLPFTAGKRAGLSTVLQSLPARLSCDALQAAQSAQKGLHWAPPCRHPRKFDKLPSTSSTDTPDAVSRCISVSSFCDAAIRQRRASNEGIRHTRGWGVY